LIRGKKGIVVIEVPTDRMINIGKVIQEWMDIGYEVQIKLSPSSRWLSLEPQRKQESWTNPYDA